MAVVIRVSPAFVVATTVGIFIFILTCVALLIYRRCFAGRPRGASATATGASGAAAGGGSVAQCRALNDVIVWVFGLPAPVGLQWVDEWTTAWTRALTQHAAKHQESMEVRFEKIRDVQSAPQISNLSTRQISSDKPLILTASVEWKRLELVLSLTSKATPNAICSIDCHVIVFEFQGIAEGVLLSSEDGSKLSVHFPTEPKMKLDVKPNQESRIDVEKLERLVRSTISGTEVQLPLWTNNRRSGSATGTSQPQQHFESRHHQESTQTANHTKLSGNATERRRKLLVKVIKANGLGSSEEKDYGSLQPFCVAVMDSPVQRYVTSSVKNTTNPFFDEHFVFDLDQSTKKLTFELHDKVRPENDDFLGMAFLTPDDFARTRHVLPLTGRGPMTYGALTVEVTAVDSSELSSSVLLLSPNVEHMSPSGESNTFGYGSSPTVTVSEAEASTLPPALETPTGSQADPTSSESKSLPRFNTLPPKGNAASASASGGKRSTFVGAIKKRFQRKKADSRSQSADRAREMTSPPGATEGGIYLTPPPSRASASTEGIPDDVIGRPRSRSSSVRSNIRRLFHRKRQKDSPTRSSTRGVDHSPEGSVGQSSPHLSSASASRRELYVPSGSPTAYEQQLR